jgi:hypothetical protein
MIPLIFIWVFTIADIFVREELSGWAKALWVLSVLILLLLGMFIYFLFRPETARGLDSESACYQLGAHSIPATDSTDNIDNLVQPRYKGI